MKRSFYNRVLENVILPFGDVVLGTCFIKQLRRWRKICTLSEKELDRLAENNLRSLLVHAVGNVPYYKSLGIEVDGNPYSAIKKFPVMKKNDIKANLSELLVCPAEKLIKCVSSGSSGIQGTTYENKYEQSIHRAMQILWWEWAGFYLGKSIIQTGMTERGVVKAVKDFLCRTEYVKAFSHSETEVRNLLLSSRNVKCRHLGGYASSINVFAETALKYGIENVRFDSVICWGDKVFGHYRKNVEKAFGAKIFETYGCAEGIMIGAKKDLDYYYIMSPHVYVEILDDNGNEVPDGAPGHVVLTRLDNYSMPLIRYYVGDLAVKLPRSKYPNEREMNFPLLEWVIGRDTDIVKMTSGRYMVVHAFTGVFEYYPQIRQFMVVQRELDKIEIQYIPSETFSPEVLDQIQSRLLCGFENELTIEWRAVDYIPATPSGKPQIIQSHLSRTAN